MKLNSEFVSSTILDGDTLRDLEVTQLLKQLQFYSAGLDNFLPIESKVACIIKLPKRIRLNE